MDDNDEEDWNGRSHDDVSMAFGPPSTDQKTQSPGSQGPPPNFSSLRVFLRQEQCCVCLQKLRNAVLIDICLHGFCFECLAQWTSHLRKNLQRNKRNSSRNDRNGNGRGAPGGATDWMLCNKCPLCKAPFAHVLAHFNGRNHFEKLLFDQQTISKERKHRKPRKQTNQSNRKSLEVVKDDAICLPPPPNGDLKHVTTTTAGMVPGGVRDDVDCRREDEEEEEEEEDDRDDDRFQRRYALYHPHEREEPALRCENCVCLDQPIVKAKGEYERWIGRELQACVGVQVDTTLFMALIEDPLLCLQEHKHARGCQRQSTPRELYCKMQNNLLALLESKQTEIFVHEVARFLSSRLNMDAYDSVNEESA